MHKFHILNIKRENWNPCIQHRIFGIKDGAPTPAMNLGDILFARMLRNGTNEYGVKGIWYLTKKEAVTPQTLVPWRDAVYATIIHYQPLIQEFGGIFSEDFRGWQSTKITGLAQLRLNGSIIPLHISESRDYLRNILLELESELNFSAEYNGKSVNVKTFLLELLQELQTPAQPIKQLVIPTPKPSPQTPRVRQPEVVGARLECPILNYEPVNELGVVVLFGFYMKDLGFSHLEQIRIRFPDAVGMLQLPDGRLQRVRIEFEYESKNFEQHNHDPNDCDIIVCWIHNWRNCPEHLQVFELKSFIENLSET